MRSFARSSRGAAHFLLGGVANAYMVRCRVEINSGLPALLPLNRIHIQSGKGGNGVGPVERIWNLEWQ